MHFAIFLNLLIFPKVMAETCFTTTYNKKLIEIYSHVASKLQEVIRSNAEENNVEELYNIEIIPLTEDFPKLQKIEADDSRVKAVS